MTMSTLLTDLQRKSDKPGATECWALRLHHQCFPAPADGGSLWVDITTPNGRLVRQCIHHTGCFTATPIGRPLRRKTPANDEHYRGALRFIDTAIAASTGRRLIWGHIGGKHWHSESDSPVRWTIRWAGPESESESSETLFVVSKGLFQR